MKINKISIGGWFQRTTLHLTEFWDFISEQKSILELDPVKLSQLHDSLNLKEFTRETGMLEYIHGVSGSGLSFRIYEDGLIILEKEHHRINSDMKVIREYYEERLSPALSYIFSKGAPVPKELADIRTILPYIITASGAKPADVTKLFIDNDETIYSTISTESVSVYRASGIILINNLTDDNQSRSIIESQIFFREFKTQLHRYLSIHRIIWEKIRKIKERGSIQGTEVDKLKNELLVYQKTINLIGARIDQMPTYVKTRQKLTNIDDAQKLLQPLFQYKFETLLDTHEYVKHLWGMTKNYLQSALDMFTDLQNKSTKNTISSLQLITTIGVVAGMFAYLGKETWPTLTPFGLLYFILLLLLTWAINSIVAYAYKSKWYKIKGKEFETNIK